MIFSILHMLEETAARTPDKLAVMDGEKAINFACLRQTAMDNAEILRELGVKPGDRVGVCMAQTVDQVISLLGILYANAVITPILPKLKHSNIAHIVDDSGMTALVTDHQRLEEVNFAKDKVRVIIGHGALDAEYPCLPYMQHHIHTKGSQFARIGHDLAAIIYSSGSTGRPKGVMVTHRNLSDGARIVATYLGTRADDHIASVLSLNFPYGMNQLWQTLYTGCSLYLPDLVMPDDLFLFLNRHRITALPVMPAIMTRLFDPRFFNSQHGLDLSCVRYVCTSGGRVSQGMLDNVKKNFPEANMILMYGLTEAFRSTYLPSEQLSLRPNSIGKAIPDCEILILDENDKECPAGMAGELVHRGGCVTRGYWKDPVGTAERFRQIDAYPGETLVFSGDLAKKDDDGFIYFLGRRDGMLKHMGIRISPNEIEAEAETHPDIESVVAFGVDNVEIGQDIVLAYTTTSGKPIQEKVLARFLKQQLPTHMIPRYFSHQHSFPSTENQGKIDRIAVRKLAAESLNIG